MTLDEAIKCIKNILRGREDKRGKTEIDIALEMAIKALQEPKLEKDGTLVVTTEHYKNVRRVLVQYGTNGTLFYEDES